MVDDRVKDVLMLIASNNGTKIWFRENGDIVIEVPNEISLVQTAPNKLETKRVEVDGGAK